MVNLKTAVDLQPIVEMLTRAELLFWLAALLATVVGRAGRTFPALYWLFGSQALSAAWYEWLTIGFEPGSAAYIHAFNFYYEAYWGLYFISAVATFFAIEQLLRSGFTQLPGLSRLAVFVFRFTGGLCLFLALTAHLPVIGRVPWYHWLRALFISFQLCICIFELVLISLLLSNARRLGLTLRTRPLGLSLGFLVFGFAELLSLVSSILGPRHTGFSVATEAGIYLTVILWTTYLLMPEGKRGPLAIKSNSTLMRWNEIVNQLGGASTMPVPAASFMSEVETLVERIMLRNAGSGI